MTTKPTYHKNERVGIQLNDGTRVAGKFVDETTEGFLVQRYNRTTTLVHFEDIQNQPTSTD